jgi:protein O-mannosyl-transferase
MFGLAKALFPALRFQSIRIYSSRNKGVFFVASVGVQPGPVVQSKANFFSRDSVFRSVIFSVLLFAVTVAVYAPLHDHPFANIDDPKYVTQNPHIENGLTAGAVLWAFTHGYSGNWHPLTWMSHAIDIQLFGLDPAGPHDENVLFHAINAVLLFWVLKRATGYTGRSLMVAALFALHPLNVESVAWVAERKTMLSTLFCFLALGAYQWYAMKPGRAGALRYLVMTFLFGLGLLSKPQIIMLPLVLLAWDYWPLRRMFAEDRAGSVIPAKSLSWLVKEKIPLFFICLLDAGVTLIAQHVTGVAQPWPLWARLENAVVSYARYIQKAFWPTRLALYYPHPGNTLRWWQVGGAAIVLLLITALALRARRQRYLIVGWLWFLIMLVPMIGIVQADVQGMADRYAYVSFVGLFIMVCWGVSDWVAEAHLPKALLPAVAACVLIALTLVARTQIGYWADNVSLWSHSAQVTTGNWKAEWLWAGALDGDGRHDEAFQHYLRAGSIEPHDPFINLGIANHAYVRGDFPMALDYYKRVLADAWNEQQVSDALNKMAVVYRNMGNPVKADECLAKLHGIPQAKVDWQGNWWQQIIPQIEKWLHGGKG